MNTSRNRRITPSAAMVLAAALLVTACGGSGKSTGTQTGSGTGAGVATASAGCKTITSNTAASTSSDSASWPYSNDDLANTRDATGSTLSSKNVSSLAQAWTYKLTGQAAIGVRPYGSLTANPIVQNGVVYLQDLDSNVYALALATGRLDWEYQCDQPEKSGPGPNGVAVAGGDVYGLTPTAAFALSATTGRTVWVKSDLLSAARERSASSRRWRRPGLSRQPVRLGTWWRGADRAERVKRSVVWRFNTVVGPEPGVQSLNVGTGGAWETPLIGSDGSVTYGIGNPYQSPASAIAHPSDQLYTDSDVNLDAATGKLRWYYQGVPNDFMDHDMQASPISTSVNGAPVVISSGKMGYVYEMNASTGKLIWKTPVGEHNGHDNDSVLALEHKLTLKAPYTILPGSLGGVLSDLAVAGNTVYVATIDLPLTYTNLNCRSCQGRRPSSGRWRRSTSQGARSNGTRRCRKCRSAPSRSPTISCSRPCTTVS